MYRARPLKTFAIFNQTLQKRTAIQTKILTSFLRYSLSNESKNYS